MSVMSQALLWQVIADMFEEVCRRCLALELFISLASIQMTELKQDNLPSDYTSLWLAFGLPQLTVPRRLFP
jgi:hypothetical protein